MNKINFFILIFLLCSAGASTPLWAGHQIPRSADQSTIIYLADSQWFTGQVQATRTKDARRFIVVKNIAYRLMPKIRIDRRVPRGPGAYNEVSATFQDIQKGQSIALRVQGFRIYQILILE